MRLAKLGRGGSVRRGRSDIALNLTTQRRTSPVAEHGEQLEVQGWSLVETVPLLLRTYVRDDVVDLIVVEAGDRGHVTKVPVMLPCTMKNCRAERIVAVMVGFVDNRQVRRPLSVPCRSAP